jgi:uncharacterized repeat protein (TIGR01451 family)
LSSCLFFLALSGVAAAQWPMPQHDAQHTGQAGVAGPHAPVEKWRLQAPGIPDPYMPGPGFTAGTAIGPDGTIYAGGMDGKAYAIDPVTGTVKHSVDNVFICCGAPAIGPDGTVYFCGNGTTAFTPDLKTVKWRYPVGMCCGSLTVGPDGTLYIGTGELHAVNPNGTARWIFNAYSAPIDGSPVFEGPAVSPGGDTVYAATRNGLYAIDAATGAIRWNHPISNTAGASVSVGPNGNIYVLSDNRILSVSPDGILVEAISLGSGKQAVSMALSYPLPPAIPGASFNMLATVYDVTVNEWGTPMFSGRGELYSIALDAQFNPGPVQWIRPLEGGIPGDMSAVPNANKPLVDVHGVIYLGTTVYDNSVSGPGANIGTHLYAFSPQGDPLFDHYAPGKGYSDTRLLSLDNTGTLYQLADGALVAYAAGQPADLSVSFLWAMPDPVRTGDFLTYTAMVNNSGPASASGVTLSDTLPAGTTFDAAWPSQGICSGQPGSPDVTCVFGDIPAGSGASVSVQVRISATGGSLTNTASVSGSFQDPNPWNNSATVTSQVLPAETERWCSITATPDPVKVGETLTYTIPVENRGPSTATGVKVTDRLPPEVSFLSVSSGQGTCAFDPASSTVTCSPGEMPVGRGIIVTIKVRLDTYPVGGILGNYVVVSGNEPDPNPYDDRADVGTKVLAEGIDLVASMAGSLSAQARRGTSLPVTITVSNQGSLPAASSAVRFYFSANTTRDGADKASKTSLKVPALASGAAFAGTVSVEIPSGLAPGSYYLIACADGSGAVPESNEGNNCAVSAIPVRVLK